jgi:hypothetical protein
MHQTNPTSAESTSPVGNVQIGNKLERRRLASSFSLATMFWFITTFLLSIGLWKVAQQKRQAFSEIERLKELNYLDSTIRVDYGRIVLFQVDDEIYALRMSSLPTNLNGASYEWMRFSKESIAESVDSPMEWKDAYQRRSTEDRGDGSTNEDDGHVIVRIGPLTVTWSRGGQEFGWLYLTEAKYSGSGDPVRFEIYRVQLEEFSQSNQINNKLWKPIRLME